MRPGRHIVLHRKLERIEWSVVTVTVPQNITQMDKMKIRMGYRMRKAHIDEIKRGDGIAQRVQSLFDLEGRSA